MGHDEKDFHALYMMKKCTLYVYIVQGKDGAKGGVPKNNTSTGGHNQARRGGLEVLVDEYLVDEEHQIYTTYVIILENLCKIFQIPTQHSHIADIYSM